MKLIYEQESGWIEMKLAQIQVIFEITTEGVPQTYRTLDSLSWLLLPSIYISTYKSTLHALLRNAGIETVSWPTFWHYAGEIWMFISLLPFPSVEFYYSFKVIANRCCFLVNIVQYFRFHKCQPELTRSAVIDDWE